MPHPIDEHLPAIRRGALTALRWYYRKGFDIPRSLDVEELVHECYIQARSRYKVPFLGNLEAWVCGTSKKHAIRTIPPLIGLRQKRQYVGKVNGKKVYKTLWVAPTFIGGLSPSSQAGMRSKPLPLREWGLVA